MSIDPQPQTAHEGQRPIENRLVVKLVASALAGAAMYFFIFPNWPMGSPQSVLHAPGPPEFGPSAPLFFHLFTKLFLAIQSVYFFVPWFLTMAYLAIFKPREPKAWVTAMMAGMALPANVFHYILYWR